MSALGTNNKSKGPSQILGYLYLGSKVDAKNKQRLQSLNIKYILNCTPQRSVDPENGCPNFFEKEKSFVYKRIPVFDNRGEDLLAHMDSAFRFIEEARHYGACLVHCHKGVSRSATIVIGYLMKKNEFTAQEALQFVQASRPMVQPNSAFLSQLNNYQPRSSIIDNADGDNASAAHASADVCGPSLPAAAAVEAASSHTTSQILCDEENEYPIPAVAEVAVIDVREADGDDKQSMVLANVEDTKSATTVAISTATTTVSTATEATVGKKRGIDEQPLTLIGSHLQASKRVDRGAENATQEQVSS